MGNIPTYVNVTNAGLINTNFSLNANQKKTVASNLKILNSNCPATDKWCKITYPQALADKYGIPFKKNIGTYEIALMPNDSLFIKESYAGKDYFDPQMVEKLSDKVAKSYGCEVTETK